MNKEIWEKIKGYNDYEVSNLGNVRSYKYSEEPLLLKPSIVSGGYRKVSLSSDNKAKQILVHRLVGETFIPNHKGKPYINHIDGNKENNICTNLEWVSQYENINKHFVKSHNPNKCPLCKNYKKHKQLLKKFQEKMYTKSK